MMKKLLGFAVAVLFVWGLSGCSLFKEKPYEMEKTAEELVREGSDFFLDGRYKKAAASFKDLKDWYPFSKYAILAELKIADAHYELKNYEEAIIAYKEFENLHPRNEAIPHVIYNRALCWYDRIDTVDRDTEPAEKALAQFLRLKKQFPESPYADQAAEKIGECIHNLAGHELYVGDFYFKTRHYKSAVARYNYLVEAYPESDAAEKALQKIDKAKKRAREESRE